MQCLHVVAASTTTTAHAALLKRTKVYHSGRRIAMQHGVLADDTGDLLAKRQFYLDVIRRQRSRLLCNAKSVFGPAINNFLPTLTRHGCRSESEQQRVPMPATRFRGRTKEIVMIFVYRNVLELERSGKVGSKQCVALLQHYVPGIGNHRQWTEGDVVMGNRDIEPGTAIATFVHGKYPSLPHGNHVAFFVKQGAGGFYIMDQWANDIQKPFVTSRFIYTGSRKKFRNGWWPGGGANAYAYSIIER